MCYRWFALTAIRKDLHDLSVSYVPSDVARDGP